jgi:hypothetical protein
VRRPARPPESAESKTRGKYQSDEAVESRWDAAPAVLVVIGLQLTLALVSEELDWKLWRLPWWVWIVVVGPEAILLTALVWDPVLQVLERIGHRRNVALILLAIISLENVGIGGLGGQHLARDRTRRQHLQVAPAGRARASG